MNEQNNQKRGSKERYVIEINHECYPKRLFDLGEIASTTSMPQQLFAIGNIELLKESNMISVIGARRASAYGLAAADFVATIAAAHNLILVSGGAIGCDSSAMRAAIENDGRVIAVLGGGADVIYPKKNTKLFSDILESGGTIISEQTWGFMPQRWTFPRRNRIIAALSLALVVVESSLKSGTFTTAEVATNLGREVLAVPGSIFSAACAGSNRLIAEDGATGIWSREDYMTALHRIYSRIDLNLSSATGPLALGEPILEALLIGPLRPAEIAESLACEPISVLRLLGMYEAQGLVIKQRDGRYSASKNLLVNQILS